MADCILAVDPGLKGALAFFFPAHPTRVSVHDMPVVDGRVSGALLLQVLDQMRPDLAVVEQVGARPTERTPQRSFNFGASFGIVCGVIEGMRIPHRLVVPARWKRHFGLGKNKERSRALALATFTDTAEHFARKKDEGRAEAALLALYAARMMGEVATEGNSAGNGQQESRRP